MQDRKGKDSSGLKVLVEGHLGGSSETYTGVPVHQMNGGSGFD